MTKLTVITPPAEEPVTLAAAKDYLRIGHDGEDELVIQLIQSARARIEQEAGLALVERELQVVWTEWPVTMSGRGAKLPLRPATSLLSVHSVSADGHSIDHTDRFRLDCGRVGLRPWSMLPVIDVEGRIELVYRAGFGPADSVPSDLKEALLQLVAVSYGARNAVGFSPAAEGALPTEVLAILDARREVRI